MDHHVAASKGVGDLENKLRSMILNNDSNESSTQSQNPESATRSRGNHRHRGGRHTRGGPHFHGVHHSHDASSGQDSQSPVFNPHIVQRQHHPSRRGGSAQLNDKNSNKQNPLPFSAVPAPTDQSHYNQRAFNHHSRRGRSFDSHHAPRNYSQSNAFVRPTADVINAQCTFLEYTANGMMPNLHMGPEELQAKERFRLMLQETCRDLVYSNATNKDIKLDLVPFGSISSGFALPGSDMDLALMVSREVPGFFRQLEKQLLNVGHGAHLLARTRVPILKVCETPNPDLLQALREERQKWDDLSPEEQERFGKSDPRDSHPEDQNQQEDKSSKLVNSDVQSLKGEDAIVSQESDPDISVGVKDNEPKQAHEDRNKEQESIDRNKEQENTDRDAQNTDDPSSQLPSTGENPSSKARPVRVWYREKRLGPLDFPKDGVGIQCDINTANPLGIHNTCLLRCYSQCDPRVEQMVLFIKAWASKRKINSSRNGTLSSYGYVLMVLHFLVNIASPPVCPNLQTARQSPYAPEPGNTNAFCEGRDVRFWRNEAEIRTYAAKGFLTHNRQPLGMLLRNFFLYYADKSGFIWVRDVLSLRTPSGLISKEQKGWTGAKTTMKNQLEVKSRYLFAIEDPFEHDHNVARTVTHNGIVAIRDEFRRAWRILQAIGRDQRPEADLFEPSDSIQPPLQEVVEDDPKDDKPGSSDSMARSEADHKTEDE